MKIILFAALLIIQSAVYAQSKTKDTSIVTSNKIEKQLIKVKKAIVAPIIDGSINEDIWKSSSWYPINKLWLGQKYDSIDFNGRFKLSWTNQALFILVEIQDDILIDQNKDPLKFWWDDDCVEVFIDENNSGGEHQYNHNAFAYHVALDANVVDMSPNESPKLYNNHIQSKIVTKENISIWELKVSIYDDTYIDGGQNNIAQLNSGKKIGFAIAYCDNDSSKERENFIGSIFVEGEDKNQGWIDANIFGTIELTD